MYHFVPTITHTIISGFHSVANSKMFKKTVYIGPIQTKAARFFRLVLSVPEHSNTSRKNAGRRRGRRKNTSAVIGLCVRITTLKYLILVPHWLSVTSDQVKRVTPPQRLALFSVSEFYAVFKTSSVNGHHLNVWGFDISAAEFPQQTRVFGLNSPIAPKPHLYARTDGRTWVSPTRSKTHQEQRYHYTPCLLYLSRLLYRR